MLVLSSPADDALCAPNNTVEMSKSVEILSVYYKIIES